MFFKKKEKPQLKANQFSFYLDAWLHCYKNKIPLTQIHRKDWEIWEVIPQ